MLLYLAHSQRTCKYLTILCPVQYRNRPIDGRTRACVQSAYNQPKTIYNRLLSATATTFSVGVTSPRCHILLNVRSRVRSEPSPSGSLRFSVVPSTRTAAVRAFRGLTHLLQRCPGGENIYRRNTRVVTALTSAHRMRCYRVVYEPEKSAGQLCLRYYYSQVPCERIVTTFYFPHTPALI